MNFNKFDFFKLGKVYETINDRIYQSTYNSNYRSVNCNNAFFEIYVYFVIDHNVQNTTNTILDLIKEFQDEFSCAT